jgi:multidrug resistance efflux pump
MKLRILGRHRGKTPAQLRAELDQADCTLIGLATEVDSLQAERDQLERQLDQAGIDLSGTLDDLRAAKQLVRHLKALVHLRDQQIDDLTRKVDTGVKAEHVIAQTQPIPVPLHQSPLAAVTDPGNVPRTA